MNIRILTATVVALTTAFSFAADDSPIKKAMQFAHKAPKGQKKICEKIADGTATDEEIKQTVELYKAAGDAKPEKGDATAFKEKWVKLLAAAQDVAAKKDGAAAAYKTAANCKACHSEHRPN
jgi:hypothetical protein